MVEAVEQRHRYFSAAVAESSAAVGESRPCRQPAKVAELSEEEAGLSSLLPVTSDSARLASGPRRLEQVRSATSEPR